MSDNVIHVRFGPGGGRRVEPPDEPRVEEPKRGTRALDKERRREPYGELFGRAEVSRLFGIPQSRLAYWARTDFITPSGKVGRRRYYTFQDLIGIRAAKELLDRGVPLQTVRRSLQHLMQTLPHVTRPLNELRVRTDGQTIVVHDSERVFEAETGQLQFDFEVRAIRDEVVRVLRPNQPDPERRRRAYESYLEGCRLDEDPATFDRAEACYREAITLDPTLANALTNWGNLRFRRGDIEEAERLYTKALSIDEGQPEAYYNLGFLAYERGDMVEAARLFASAVKLDPGFADAHFNLAMALEEAGRREEARTHWESYLELDPEGPWAEIARRHLGAAWR